MEDAGRFNRSIIFSFFVLLILAPARVASAGDKGLVVRSSRPELPIITSVKFKLDQLRTERGVMRLKEPSLLGDVSDESLSSFFQMADEIRSNHPEAQEMQFTRVGDQVMVLPFVEQMGKIENHVIHVGFVADLKESGNYRILRVSKALAAHMISHIDRDMIIETHEALNTAFDAAVSGRPREAEARYPVVILDAAVSVKNNLKPAMPRLEPAENSVIVPPGMFLMGSPEDEPGRFREEVLHTVVLTHYLEVAKYKTTQQEFLDRMGYNPSTFRYLEHSDGDYKKIGSIDVNVRHPVETVSMYQMVEYLNKHSEQDGLEPAYVIIRNPEGYITGVYINGLNIYETKGYDEDRAGYRLPTEAEGQRFVRAGTTTPLWIGYYGKDKLDAHVWHYGNSNDRTHVVDLKPANPWGIRDAHGNAFELRHDEYGLYPSETVIDPAGPSTDLELVVGSGGSYLNDVRSLRSAYRKGFDPRLALPHVSFREVRSRNPAPARADRP